MRGPFDPDVSRGGTTDGGDGKQRRGMCGGVCYGNLANKRRVQGLDVLEVRGWKRVWSWQCFGGFHVYQLHFRINVQCWRQHGRVPFIFAYDV